MPRSPQYVALRYMSPVRDVPIFVFIGTLAVHITPPPGRTKLGEHANTIVPLVAFMLTKSFGLPIA